MIVNVAGGGAIAILGFAFRLRAEWWDLSAMAIMYTMRYHPSASLLD